jgi:hypothetical protein
MPIKEAAFTFKMKPLPLPVRKKALSRELLCMMHGKNTGVMRVALSLSTSISQEYLIELRDLHIV